MTKQKLLAHFGALFTSFIWGVTFISSKILLNYFSPLAIVLLRCGLAYIVLWILYPKFHKIISLKNELFFILAGFTGITLYFLFENKAIGYTTLSNVSIILASAPLFVAITTSIFTKDEHLKPNLIIGFFIAIIGISLVIYNGNTKLSVNPLGDFLAIAAAIVWSFYSLSIKKLDPSLPSIYKTRKVFFYGILSSSIILFLTGDIPDFSLVFSTTAYIHVLFLGIVASALCFVFWNKSISIIGAIKTSNYIYLMPFFTVIASAIFLHESITFITILGCLFILFGTYVSERGIPFIELKDHFS